MIVHKLHRSPAVGWSGTTHFREPVSLCPRSATPIWPTRPALRTATVLLLALYCLVLAAGEVRAFAGGELEVRITDADTGSFVPARMHLKDRRGKPITPPGLLAWKDHFIVPGKAVLKVRPGVYFFELERGPEYKIRTGQFTVNPITPGGFDACAPH